MPPIYLPSTPDYLQHLPTNSTDLHRSLAYSTDPQHLSASPTCLLHRFALSADLHTAPTCRQHIHIDDPLLIDSPDPASSSYLQNLPTTPMQTKNCFKFRFLGNWWRRRPSLKLDRIFQWGYNSDKMFRHIPENTYELPIRTVRAHSSEKHPHHIYIYIYIYISEITIFKNMIFQK